MKTSKSDVFLAIAFEALDPYAKAERAAKRQADIDARLAAEVRDMMSSQEYEAA